MSNSRKRRREVVQEMKNAPCTDCGRTFHYSMMQYDHVGNDKVMSVCHLLKVGSMQAVMDEIAKCELVCMLCHSVRTWNRQYPETPITADPIN